MRTSVRSWRSPRVMLTVAVATVPLVLIASAVPAALAGTASSTGGSSLWLSGTTTSGYTTSLADVRTIINASSGPAAALTGRGVGVAMIDTGVAPVAGLPASQIVNGPDLSFESQAPNLRYLDGYGHGTHLAGIIVGNDPTTGAKGLAPEAKLTSIKVGTANGAADVTQTIAAVDWVVQHRNDDPANPIRVLNMSYNAGGNPNYWTDPLMYAVEQAWKAGIVVVTAAGNQGPSLNKLADPAADPWVIAVAASDTKGTLTLRDDVLTSYTNIDTSRYPDVAAPGESIASLRVPGSNVDNLYPAARVGDTLFKGSGTSQAAAVTSAAAALLLQYRPGLTPGQLKQYLIMSRNWLVNGQYGLGQVNVNGAISQMLAVPNPNTQVWQWGYGNGLVEAARGNDHVASNGVQLTGEKTIFGAFSSTTWLTHSSAATSWSGGIWMGNRFAGDGWTGTSWASKTWADAGWTGQPWGGATSWTDPNWTGRNWVGDYWLDGNWTSQYWSAGSWATAHWS